MYFRAHWATEEPFMSRPAPRPFKNAPSTTTGPSPLQVTRPSVGPSSLPRTAPSPSAKTRVSRATPPPQRATTSTSVRKFGDLPQETSPKKGDSDMRFPFFSRSVRRQQVPRQRSSFRPRLEALEDR